jgi:hypothetical protein
MMKRWIATLALVIGCSEARAAAVAELAEPAAPSPVSGLPLAQRLANEASARPERAVRPAQLLEALQQQGITITRKQQVLASPVEASYCELALTDTGLALSLCEFSDADAAERGLARSMTSFDAMIPGRTLDTRANALLTVTKPASPDAERQRELARSTFAGLQPTR